MLVPTISSYAQVAFDLFNMPRIYVKRTGTGTRKWSDEEMQQAIDSVKAGESVNSARRRFGISEGLRYRLKKLESG